MTTNRDRWPIESKYGWGVAALIALFITFSDGFSPFLFIIATLAYMAVMMIAEWAWRTEYWLPPIIVAAIMLLFVINEIRDGGWWALLFGPIYAVLCGAFLGRGLKNVARS